MIGKVQHKGLWIVVISSIVCVSSMGVFLMFMYTINFQKSDPELQTFIHEQVHIVVNKKRKEFNVAPLLLNTKLMQAAQEKAIHMNTNGYFSHVSPSDEKKWSDFIRDQGYDYLEAGENLANGFIDANELVNAWMASPTHRENILNKNVDETGFGIKIGRLRGAPTVFVVQVFGKLDG
jgi:uncharacterized protein YkwD